MDEIKLNTSKRFYYLKLKFEFFTQPSVLMILNQEHGSDIILLFLRMIGAAANCNGYLKFSDSEPYTAESLSVVFGFPRAVVESALVALQRFHLIDILDDKTIVVLNIKNYVGSESVWAEKKRNQRAGKKAAPDNIETPDGQIDDNSGTTSRSCPIDIDIDTDIEIEKDIQEEENNKLLFVDNTPAREEVRDFCRKCCHHVNPDGFFNYYQKRDWTINGEQIHDWRAVCAEWDDQIEREIRAGNVDFKKERELWKEYEKKFGKKVDAAYFGKPILVQTAIATETPLIDG